MARVQGESQRLGWTLAALVAAMLPHFLHLKPWITVLVLGLCAWRWRAAVLGKALPGRWLRVVAVILAAGGVAISYRSFTGLDGGTALLTLMAGLKLLETRSPRDHVVVVFIGLFLCLATFLYTQGFLSALWVVPTVWLLAAALLNVARPVSDGAALKPFRVTGAMLAKALPLAIVLFLFFPRVAGHFWGAPSSERALSGLTEEMSPGEISDLTLNDSVAFRVRFDDALPPPIQRYWRGPVMTEFDGYTWSRARAQAYFKPPVTLQGEAIDYTVTLEPTQQRMLFALDMVESWPEALADQRWDYQLLTHKPINAVLQYRASSRPQYQAGLELSAALRNRHLQLPRGRNPKAMALAQEMRAQARSDRHYIDDVLGMFRREQFYYTLTPPRLNRDSVDEFLFETREGFCGHYASAFTMLMRAAGVPARVVGGYQGGNWNPLGRYLIVRQSHAHAWSEVWLQGAGWVRVDPTAAIAPERVERGIEEALNAEDLLSTGLLRDSDWRWQWRMLWDNANATWNDWIVRFDLPRQQQLMSWLGFIDPDWQEMGMMLAAGVIACLLLLSGWLNWEFRPLRRDPAAASYQKFVRRLGRRGIEREPHEGPRHLAARVSRWRPDLGVEASAITETYLRVRYLPEATAHDLLDLQRRVRRFRP